MNIELLNAAQAVALSKIDLDPKNAKTGQYPHRDQLADACEYAVDFTVRVHGLMKIGEGSPHCRNAQSVPWQKIAVVVLSKLNSATIDAVLEEVLGAPAKELEILAKLADERAQVALDKLLGARPTGRRGAVSLKGIEIEVVK